MPLVSLKVGVGPSWLSLFVPHWDKWSKNVHFTAVINYQYGWVGGTHRYPMGGKISNSIGMISIFGRFSIFYTVAITVVESFLLENGQKRGKFFFELFDPSLRKNVCWVPNTTLKQFECDITPNSDFIAENSFWLFYEKSKIGRNSKMSSGLFEVLPHIDYPLVPSIQP